MRRALVCLMALSLAASAFAVVNPTGKHWKHDTGLTKCDDGTYKMKCVSSYARRIDWNHPSLDIDGGLVHFHYIKAYKACVVNAADPVPTGQADCILYFDVYKKPPVIIDLAGPNRCVHLQTVNRDNLTSAFSTSRACN